MPSDCSTLPFELNEDLWFEDGDLHVCARRSDSGALCLYKLYRDLLAVHSTRLLKLLDKALSRIYIGTTPYVFLPDDALNLERFFIAIYYPTYYFFWKHNTRTFRHTLPVFKIALKYKANNVIESLASQLEEDWPQTISEWDASQCGDGPFAECQGGLDSVNRLPDYRQTPISVIEPASAIQVARISNTPNVLSAAYYQLSRTQDPECWDEAGGGSLLESERGGGGQSLLSKEDSRHLVAGRERLSRHMTSFKKRIPHALALHSKCSDAWNSGAAVQSKSIDPLADLLELCSGDVIAGKAMCSECRSLINERGREERVRVWALLPRFFCLPHQ